MRKAFALQIIVGLSVLIVACGGSDSEGTSDPQATSTSSIA